MSNKFSEICEQRDLRNHDLVEACPEPLTHKVVQKARLGKELSARAQRKILDALNNLARQREWECSFKKEEIWDNHGSAGSK